MKKVLTVLLIAVFVLTLVACGGEEKNPYNEAAREGWDLYGTLDCFVKTEYNKEGNPILREFYHTQTWEKGLAIRYRYDKKGVLDDVRMEGKGFSTPYFKNLRFELSFGEDGSVQNGRPLYDNHYESISYTWNENGKLTSEYMKNEFIMIFDYDENGGVTREHYSEAAKELMHRYNEDGSGIMLTEKGSLNEVMSVTFGENGMPETLTHPEYTIHYTYNEDALCTEAIIKVMGQKLSQVLITYDENGAPIKREVNAYKSENETIPAALYEYGYDENGNMTKETVSQVDSSLKMKIASDCQYGYDDRGNITQEVRDVYTTPGNHTSKVLVNYGYDKDGNMTEVFSQIMSPAGTTVRDKGITRYYTDGKLRSTTEYDFHTNHTVKTVKETEYNNQQKTVKKTSYEYWQGEKIDGVLVDGHQRSQEIVEYNDKGVPSKHHLQEFTKEGVLRTESTILYYDADSPLVYYDPVTGEQFETAIKKSYVSIGYYSDGSIYKKSTEEYYDTGNLKFEETLSYTQEGVLIERYTTEKDQKGNPLKWYHLQAGGTEKENEQSHEYTYYENGNMKKLVSTFYFVGVLGHTNETQFNTVGETVKFIRMTYQDGKLYSKEERFIANNSLQKIVTYRYDENGNEISREEKPA